MKAISRIDVMTAGLGLLLVKILIASISFGDSLIGISLAGLIFFELFLKHKEEEKKAQHLDAIQELREEISKITLELHSVKTQIGFSKTSKPVSSVAGPNEPRKRYF
jgi:hypothetical protein